MQMRVRRTNPRSSVIREKGTFMITQHDFEAILSNLHDGLYVVDKQRRVTLWNEAAERITGYTAAEVIGSRCSDSILIHVDQEGHELCHTLCPLAATIKDGASREADVFLHHKQGHRIPVSIRITPLTDTDGNIIGGIELFTDSSSLNSLRQRLNHLEKLALVDALTELPNRRQVESEIRAQLAAYERNGVPFCVLFADIDRFKRFNDEHGHEAGDLALKTVARTMASSVRPYDTIGRWGGEEFVGVLPNCNAPGGEEIAQRLCMLVRHSRVETREGSLRLAISMGGAVAVSGDTVESLVARADAMMYQQKQRGGDGALFESDLERTVSRP